MMPETMPEGFPFDELERRFAADQTLKDLESGKFNAARRLEKQQEIFNARMDRLREQFKGSYIVLRSAASKKNFEHRIIIRKRELQMKLYREHMMNTVWKTKKEKELAMSFPKPPPPQNETDQRPKDGHLEDKNLDGARPENPDNQVPKP